MLILGCILLLPLRYLASFFVSQWAIKIRGDTRKAQAIPQLVELLRIDYDPTIRAAAIALRNVCVDSENKRTVGKTTLAHPYKHCLALSSVFCSLLLLLLFFFFSGERKNSAFSRSFV